MQGSNVRKEGVTGMSGGWFRQKAGRGSSVLL